jgi:glycosyltransferase involved in cell wall biosynthesis
MRTPQPTTHSRLSICIPTHSGRAAVLSRALDSIVAQLEGSLNERVQVCISDNGSEDETQTVIARHRVTLGHALVDHRFESNRGFTSNLLKAVEISDGEFCWLLGSDDTIEPGGIAMVLSILDANPDLTGMTTNRRNVDDAAPERVAADDPRILPPAGRTRYASAKEVFAELALLQDYISTQVVRRSAWMEAIASLGSEGIAAGRNFPHLPIIGEMIRRRPWWYWHDEGLVRHRIGAQAVHSTFGHGMARYVVTVTEDRARIWRAMFGRRSPLYRAAMGRARLVQLHGGMVTHYKVQPDHTLADDLRLLVAMTRWYWFLPEFWTQSMVALVMPHQIVPRAQRAATVLRRARNHLPLRAR